MGVASLDLGCSTEGLSNLAASAAVVQGKEEIAHTGDKSEHLKLQCAYAGERNDVKEPTKVSACHPSAGQEGFNTAEASLISMSQDMEDSLEAQGVENELLLNWARSEQKALASTNKVPPTLPLHVRDNINRFLQHLIQFACLPPKKWYEVVNLLDIYHLRKKDAISIDSLPATCAALIMLMKKSDCSIVQVGAHHFVPHTIQLAQWLQRLGFSSVSTDVTEKMLLRAEKDVLEVLEWKINFPSLESWTSAFCTRFNILTKNLFERSVSWAWQRSLVISRWIMMRKAASSEEPPQKIAIGILALGLVAARLLPGEAFRPPRISPADWEDLHVESKRQDATLPPCLPSEENRRQLLEILQATVAFSMSEVQEACLLTATIVRDNLADMQGLQQGAGACTEHAANI